MSEGQPLGDHRPPDISIKRPYRVQVTGNGASSFLHPVPSGQPNGSGSPIIETAFARAAVSRRRWCWRQSTS